MLVQVIQCTIYAALYPLIPPLPSTGMTMQLPINILREAPTLIWIEKKLQCPTKNFEAFVDCRVNRAEDPKKYYQKLLDHSYVTCLHEICIQAL